MKSVTSLFEHFVIGLPLAFGVATVSYVLLIWLALRKKDFVKATIWHRTSGFSIEARNGRRKHGQIEKN
jgi:hypothetical protein